MKTLRIPASSRNFLEEKLKNSCVNKNNKRFNENFENTNKQQRLFGKKAKDVMQAKLIKDSSKTLKIPARTERYLVEK